VLRTLVDSCTDGQTSAMYTDDTETVLVRGYVETRPDLSLPAGEALVRVPRSLVAEGASRLAGQ
jgi:hypothetical protein